MTTYSANGKEIYQICMKTGAEGLVEDYLSPDELWNKEFSVQNKCREEFAEIPFEDKGGSWQLRYYQKVNDLEELKKAILQKAFNGELNSFQR